MRRVSHFALPADLRRGIENFISNVSGADLSSRAQSISQNYNLGRPSRKVIASSADVAAYLATRAPASFAAVAAVLSALGARAPTLSPLSVLDVGSGPGTASWAAVEEWPSIGSVTLIDENEEMVRAARSLCAQAGHAALRTAKCKRAGIGAAISENVHDLVVASYVIGELGRGDRRAALELLWRLTAHALVIVEPGTPEGFARIRDARDLLVKAGAKIAAPCPHARSCPLSAPDWCHFGQNLPRSRDHMRAKRAKLPFEVEKFSYLVLTRDLSLIPAEARIIDRPSREKFGVRFRLCRETDVVEHVVLKRDRAVYRGAAHKKWGETLPL
jgi:ribosomal protein RSM22 (predicted rRNA methylase)